MRLFLKCFKLAYFSRLDLRDEVTELYIGLLKSEGKDAANAASGTVFNLLRGKRVKPVEMSDPRAWMSCQKCILDGSTLTPVHGVHTMAMHS